MHMQSLVRSVAPITAMSMLLTACSNSMQATPGGASAALPGQSAPQVESAGQSIATKFFAHGRNIEVAVQRGRTLGKAQIMFIKGVDYAPTPICNAPLETPLANGNRAIWKRDLTTLRALGVNAIKVYNSNADTTIGDFLVDAYNNGDHPIYVILSIFFPAAAASDKNAVDDLSTQYRALAQINGSYKAVMGMSIGSEVNADNYIGNPDWWKGMTKIALAAKDGFKLSGNPDKIITTTMVDDGMKTVRQGEDNKFPVDAWGVNAYRGPDFGELWSSYQKASKKPFIVSEWGTPAGYHPGGDPNKAIGFPSDKVKILTDYVGGLAKQMYDHSTLNGGPGSGGFYFEWSDEWWKAGDSCIQLTNPKAPNDKFAGGFDDEAWFGLNIISAGKPNVLTPRPTYATLKDIWANQ